jgi:hypothetical protein
VLPQEWQVIGQGCAVGYCVPQWVQQEFFSNIGIISLQVVTANSSSKI